jgi:hypothetical protein
VRNFVVLVIIINYRRRAEKRDSMYYLQRTMERRTEETRIIREQAEERKVTLSENVPGSSRYH